MSVEATRGEILQILETSEQRASLSASIGLFCEGDFYDLEDDVMWGLSRIFLFVALGIAGIAVIIAWSISTFALPTRRKWKLISVASALSAVVQVPVFLVFEAEPCKDYPMQQKCELSTGCYLLMGSIICSVFVTILTVCLDPPEWVGDLDTWRIPKGRTADTSDDGGSIVHSPCPPSEASSYFGQLRHSSHQRNRPKDPLSSSPNPGSVQGGVGSIRVVKDLGLRASEANDTQSLPLFTMLPSRAETATARSISTFANYGARPDDESAFGASSHITGDDSFLGNAAANERGDLEMAAPDNTVAATATVATIYSSAKSSVGEVSDVDLNTLASARLRLDPRLQLDQGPPADAPAEIPKEIPKVPPKTAAIFGFAARRRRTRVSNGYAFLDDDDTDSAPMMSPPLEVTVSIAKHGEDNDFAAIHSAHEDDQDLLDDWNALHNYLPAPVRENVARDPDPLVLSSDDDDSDISDPEKDDEDYLKSGSIKDPVDNRARALLQSDPGHKSPRSASKVRRRLRSTNSVSSGTSLLDLTIEEETAVDLLKEFESDADERKDAREPVKLVRQRSAPNLAAFNSKSANREKVCEDLHMDGLNSYHGVETWRSKGPMRPSVEKPKPHATDSNRIGRSRSLTPLRGIRRLVSRSPSPRRAGESASLKTPRRVPLWKEEREIRGGIHAEDTFSGDSSDDNQSHSSSPSLLSRARLARIKRLQRASPTPDALDTTPTRRTRAPVDRGLVSPDDTGSMLLDTLDLQLAKGQRPDGAEYGPDEVSL